MRSTVKVVVVGAGVLGASVAYHIARLGSSDVMVLEKSELSSGSTWHAAGLIPQTARSVLATRLLMEGPALFPALEAETGQSVGWHRTGGVRVASSRRRVDELRFLADRAKAAGLEYELIGPTEIKRIWPLAQVRGIKAGLWTPAEGHVDPSSLTAALAKAAAARGVVFRRRTRVESIERLVSGEFLIHTTLDDVLAEVVVNAGGQWARDLGAMVGVDVPVVPVEHQYVVTAEISEVAGLDFELPLWREPEGAYYVRQEQRGLVVGVYESNARAWSPDLIPRDFDQQLLPPALDRIEPYLAKAARRISAFGTAGLASVVNGPDAYTPDNRFLVGQVPGMSNYFVVAGFNSLGIASAVGAGRLCAEWVVAGHPTRDAWPFDIRRFGEHAAQLEYAVAKVLDNYARHTALHIPDHDRPTARPIKTDPIYDTLDARGAVFGERMGWERPLRFGARAGSDGFEIHPSEFAAVARECDNVRNGVGVIDQTTFGKFEIRGSDAGAFLDRVCANRLPQVGRIVYTVLLTPHGGIAGELTVSQPSKGVYYLVCAGSLAVHHLSWLQDHLPSSRSVDIVDKTGVYGVLSVMGPKARTLMERIAEPERVSAERFAFLDVQPLDCGVARVRAMRVSFVGELGWELHHPLEMQRYLYERIVGAGQDLGLADFGYQALNSLGLEKSYPVWGEDLSPAVSPIETGLDRFVAVNKGDFVGRDAYLRNREIGPLRHLVTLTISDSRRVPPRGGEPIIDESGVVSTLTVGGFGHTVGTGIGRAFLPIAKSTIGTRFGVQVLQDYRDAVVVGVPYDPDGRRLRT